VQLSPVDPSDPDGRLAAVGRRLSGHVHELADAMAQGVLSEVPAYAWRAGGEADDFRNGLVRIASLYVRTLEDQRRLRDDELVALHVIGAQRARQAVPVETLTAGIRSAVRAAWRHVGNLAAVTTGPTGAEVVAHLGTHLLDFSQDVLDAVRQGYRTEVEQRLTGMVRAQAAFIDRLLEGHWQDEAEARAHALALGHDLRPDCGLLLVMSSSGQDTLRLRGAATLVAESVERAVEGPLRTLPLPHVVILVPSPSEDAWTTALRRAEGVAHAQRLTLVPSEPVPLTTTLAGVYRDAQRYLLLAEADDRGSGLVSMKELRLYGVFAGIPVSDRVEFVRDTLGPVLDLSEHKARELLETLESVYRCKGRIADAAADLHLHQNSVRYRLARVEELTGLSLDVPADRMQLELAMRLRRVATAELASLDDSSPASVSDPVAERPASA
jgi:hypothetical protein